VSMTEAPWDAGAEWGMSRAVYAAYRAQDSGEFTAMKVACPQCDAPVRQLCYAPTGLPASSPHPVRVAAAEAAAQVPAPVPPPTPDPSAWSPMAGAGPDPEGRPADPGRPSGVPSAETRAEQRKAWRAAASARAAAQRLGRSQRRKREPSPGARLRRPEGDAR
jgi:hypothetical protein